MIAVAFISDRGDKYLPKCVESFDADVKFDACRIVDDSDHQLGLSGAVRTAWEWALEAGADHLLHIEEDFTFNERVPVRRMLFILKGHPELSQVVLKRQAAWSPEEQAAGGIVECHPDDYTECTAGGLVWTEHERTFSLNPCLIPRRTLELGWGHGDEGAFTARVLAVGMRFAFYGGKFDPPRVHHIGDERSSGWRL